MIWKRPTHDTKQGTLVYEEALDGLSMGYPLQFLCINELDKDFPYVVLEEDGTVNAYQEVFLQPEINEDEELGRALRWAVDTGYKFISVGPNDFVAIDHTEIHLLELKYETAMDPEVQDAMNNHEQGEDDE